MFYSTPIDIYGIFTITFQDTELLTLNNRAKEE